MASPLPTVRRGFPPRGQRNLRLEQLEGRFLLDGASLIDDSFNLHQNGSQVSLDVLANDQFEETYEGARLITSVSYGSQGGRIEFASDRQNILYTPPADFFGTESFVYAVDSEYTAQVQVTLQAPLAFDQFQIPPDGTTRQLSVLANDPFWDGYDGARRITAVSVGSAGGTVTIGPDGQSVLYTPPDGAYGKETFIYVVDDLYPAQVTIEIPETLKNDEYEFVQHEPPATLHVLANDPFWPGYSGDRQITHLTESSLGATLEISEDGKSVIYTQPEEFDASYNYSSWDSFRYVVDGSYEAYVYLYLHRPVQNDAFEVDENSTDFFFNVTSNDRYRDLDGHWHDVIDRVTSVGQPESGGIVTVSAGGVGIRYTPPAGFTGSDTFTYMADGVHEATVYVNVTRPVRDDYISSGVYQDTPNNVVQVLANDFLGNGYSGPRLITEVSAGENGGVITIRSDGRALLYTPAPGYVGQDTFTYSVDGVLEATATVNLLALAQNDSLTLCPDPDHGAYTISVLGNDYFSRGYAGPGIVTGVEIVSGSGEASVQSGSSLLFTPATAGTHQLRYTVDVQYEATVSVRINEHLDPDHAVVNQNSSGMDLYVLTNDFEPDPSYVACKAQNYRGQRIITAVTQSEHGGMVTLAEDGRSVNYSPPTDFFGTDTFTYIVDDFMVEVVSVEVIRRVRDDEYRVDAEDGPQILPVLVNDLFGANYSGPGQITDVTESSAGGSVEVGDDGHSIIYTPPVDFVGADTFTYTVDGALKAQVSIVVDAARDDQFPTFDSLEAYHQFLIDDALVRYQYLFGSTAWNYALYPTDVVFRGDAEAGPGTRNHSETNVQVAGVDEGDIVEFDSDYVYMLTDDEVIIVDAWPTEELNVASRVSIEGRTIAEYLHGDRLTVISEIGGGFIYPYYFDGRGPAIDFFAPYPPTFEPWTTFVTVIDVTDRAAPSIVQTTSMEGRYVDSRGVGDYVYVLVNNDNAVAPQPHVIDEDDDPDTPNRYETQEEYLARVSANPGEFVEEALPNYTSYGADGEMVRTGLLNMPEDIYQPIVPEVLNLISVVSVNVEADEPGLTDTSAVYGTGASTIYASLDNFYVFDNDYTDEDGSVTRIVKFDWESETGGVEFAATTTVAGRLLNQFSADENGDFLRVATTAGNRSSGNWSARDENLLFVLQEDEGVFEFVGSLQNLALNETMRSVRFLGDRAFVTTYRNVDPLFALDLSDPASPKSMGHITLPGFTSYMHLVDENHLLTVGRNTPAGFSGPTQVSLFDIADLGQPIRVAEYTFPRFSTSEAELDHHAFGYYDEHGLLGMPVATQYIERVDVDGDGYSETSVWVREDQLAVFSVDVSALSEADRLTLVSEIQHDTPVRRSGYIGDKLYSIAGDSIKVVAVEDPATVIGELIVIEPEEDNDASSNVGDPLDGPFLGNQNATAPATELPAVRSDDVLLSAVASARAQLAARLETPTGAPLLVTVEATPESPGGGHTLVLQVGENLYSFRAGGGMIEQMEGGSEFQFAIGAWHAVAPVVVAPPGDLAGDYNSDGSVDKLDYELWKHAYGDGSLTTYLAADGNRNGRVDAADYGIWRDNFRATTAPVSATVGAGDFNADHVVDGADYDLWKQNSSATAGDGLRADANGDGIVSAADYTIWRDRLGEATAVASRMTSSTSASSVDRTNPASENPSTSSDGLLVVTDEAFAVIAMDASDGGSVHLSSSNSTTPSRVGPTFSPLSELLDDLLRRRQQFSRTSP